MEKPNAPKNKLIAIVLVTSVGVGAAAIAGNIGYEHVERNKLKTTACAGTNPSEPLVGNITAKIPFNRNGKQASVEFGTWGAGVFIDKVEAELKYTVTRTQKNPFGFGQKTYTFDCMNKIVSYIGLDAEVQFSQPICRIDSKTLHAVANVAFGNDTKAVDVNLDTPCDPNKPVQGLKTLTYMSHTYGVND